MPPAGITSPPAQTVDQEAAYLAHHSSEKLVAFAGRADPQAQGAADVCVFGLVLDTADHGGLSRAQ